MTAEKKKAFITVLTGAQTDLNQLAIATEAGVGSVSSAFRTLATQADSVLKQAAAIVNIVENEGVSTVLAKVQSLCLSVKGFLEQRLEAAGSILDVLQGDRKLLKLLIRGTQRQTEIARQLKALSVFTNVEVAYLGNIGDDFQILAQELSTFAKSVSDQTLELSRQTESRELAIEETRRELAVHLPGLRADMNQLGDGFTVTLKRIDADLGQLAMIPGKFRACAEDTSRQIAGVVAAIQAHDITRQQIEHVQEALQLIAARIAAVDRGQRDETPLVYAGLTIQIYQLKTTKETVANWTSQVKRCMGGIRQLSASDVLRIGPVVLEQERELSSQLTNIEVLQEKSQEYSKRIQNTLGGLSSLFELVKEHQGRSQYVRHRLQLLRFNSLIKAHHMSRQGVVVSAIANLINEVSVEWNVITEQSGVALTEILRLVKKADEVMGVFSEASSQTLRENRSQTIAILNNVRGAAGLVAKEASRMQVLTETMQGNLANFGDKGDAFDVCFGHLDTALSRIEGLARGLESENPQIAGQYDAAEAERLFSASYTTEVERNVMNAALYGAPLPVMEQSFAGNDVELF
ncbi:MAG: hypothetical protein ABSA96_08430 [Candidatus Acidiferrales bacterium]|jgi:hypothetical protein